MILTIDTAAPLSTTEQNLLKILLSGVSGVTADQFGVWFNKTPDVPTAPAAPAKVKKAEPAPAPVEETAAEVASPVEEAPVEVAEPAVEEPSVLDEAPAEGDFTMAAAVSRATELVSAGKTGRIREVLQGLAGAKRVSELKSPKAIESFLHALRND